jgi:hypothetical protein
MDQVPVPVIGLSLRDPADVLPLSSGLSVPRQTGGLAAQDDYPQVQ